MNISDSVFSPKPYGGSFTETFNFKYAQKIPQVTADLIDVQEVTATVVTVDGSTSEVRHFKLKHIVSFFKNYAAAYHMNTHNTYKKHDYYVLLLSKVTLF